MQSWLEANPTPVDHDLRNGESWRLANGRRRRRRINQHVMDGPALRADGGEGNHESRAAAGGWAADGHYSCLSAPKLVGSRLLSGREGRPGSQLSSSVKEANGLIRKRVAGPNFVRGSSVTKREGPSLPFLRLSAHNRQRQEGVCYPACVAGVDPAMELRRESADMWELLAGESRQCRSRGRGRRRPLGRHGGARNCAVARRAGLAAAERLACDERRNADGRNSAADERYLHHRETRHEARERPADARKWSVVVPPDAHSFLARLNVQLRQDFADVPLRAVEREAQCFRDLRVRTAARYETHHFALPGTEVVFVTTVVVGRSGGFRGHEGTVGTVAREIPTPCT